MMDEKKLLDAMSDIDENYIQDAKNFRERKVVRGRFAAKSVAAAAIVVLLAGTTVYGATMLVKQLHMKGYTSVENLAKDHDIKPWQSNIGYQDADFNEEGFKAIYEESEISGMDGTTTTLNIQDNMMILERVGSTTTNMEFKEGAMAVSLYNTPYGVLNLNVDTEKLNININENGGEIYSKYILGLEGQEGIVTELNIKIKVN